MMSGIFCVLVGHLMSFLEKCLLKYFANLKKNLQTIHSGEGVEKRESSCIVGENVN